LGEFSLPTGTEPLSAAAVISPNSKNHYSVIYISFSSLLHLDLMQNGSNLKAVSEKQTSRKPQFLPCLTQYTEADSFLSTGPAD
jgi:hypothetical protein